MFMLATKSVSEEWLGYNQFARYLHAANVWHTMSSLFSRTPSEQIMIKLMFRFINGVGDFTAQGNNTDIILRVSHHPLLFVGFGKQHACR